MKHYKSPENDVYAYELDGSQDHLIPVDFVLLTQQEVDAIREIQHQEWLAAQPTKEEQIAKLQEQIDALNGAK